MNSVRVPMICVAAGMLAGLLWKWPFFQFADQTYHDILIRHDFFPARLQAAATLRWAYLATIASLLVAVAIPVSRFSSSVYWSRLVASMACWLGSTVLLVHQGSYNDMTFVTAWWCAAFLVWYSSRMGIDEPAAFISKAAILSRVMVSLVFLGGAVGKWTDEYWSGQVLYEIYFDQRDFWFFTWLRDHLDAEGLRAFATGYSRLVIVTESLGGFLWAYGYFMKSKTISILAILTFLAIGVLSNFFLFSVLAPMIGLALVGCFSRDTRADREK